MKRIVTSLIVVMASMSLPMTELSAQEVLPFPEPESASTAGKTLKDSKHQWRRAESRLPEDAPNIVIFMTDDAGFSNPSTFGGPIHTPTLDRLAASGRRIERSVPAVHTASETFDVGVDLGSPVALDYYDRAPFRFNGEIEKIHIRYLEQSANQ